mmetsp:Transcript_28263/g.91510  ORF Transcript_28263/g.91510 Transcript_28263/m.91510 type:complete len:215 (-) Transcript_28263:374-1018(-)
MQQQQQQARPFLLPDPWADARDGGSAVGPLVDPARSRRVGGGSDLPGAGAGKEGMVREGVREPGGGGVGKGRGWSDVAALLHSGHAARAERLRGVEELRRRLARSSHSLSLPLGPRPAGAGVRPGLLHLHLPWSAQRHLRPQPAQRLSVPPARPEQADPEQQRPCSSPAAGRAQPSPQAPLQLLAVLGPRAAPGAVAADPPQGRGRGAVRVLRV